MRIGICMRNVDAALRAFVMDVDHDDVGEMLFTNNLNEMRRLTGAQNIRILSAKVAGIRYRVVANMHARDSDALKASGVDASGEIIVSGPLVFVGSDVNGDDEMLRSLTDGELLNLQDHVALVDMETNGVKTNTYVMCDMEMRT